MIDRNGFLKLKKHSSSMKKNDLLEMNKILMPPPKLLFKNTASFHLKSIDKKEIFFGCPSL